MTKPKHITDDVRMERIWRLERIVYALTMDSGIAPEKYHPNLKADLEHLKQDLEDDGELPRW